MCACMCVLCVSCLCITSVDAEASLLGVSLRELAAVVKLQCTAEVHRFLRGDCQLNTSAKQSEDA